MSLLRRDFERPCLWWCAELAQAVVIATVTVTVIETLMTKERAVTTLVLAWT